MNINNDTNDDILVKYLLGEASKAEQKEVKEWIATSAENRHYYEQFKLIWDQSKLLGSETTVDENAAWARLVNRTEHDSLEEKSATRIIPLYQKTWIKAAAIFLVSIAIGAVIYNRNTDSNMQMLMANSGNEARTDTLPDGSVVVLNKNSSLTYPSRFDGDKRSVTLRGEAFFSITPNKSKPFVIDANNTSVTVVGTTFNVKTTTEKTEVIVETGVVQVAKKEKMVKVMPHQKATVTAGKEDPETGTNNDELYGYYRKEFICKATPLSKLVDVLNDAYNVHIAIPDTKLAGMQYTGTFKNETLENILKVLKETFNLNVEYKGHSIILSPAK